MSAERWVPKVHPATRAAESEDPYELFATSVPGDPELMLRCLVQEYAWMGWGTDQLLAMFRDPFNPALHRLLQIYGEENLGERIAAIIGSMGVFRFEGVVRDEPEREEPEEPTLIELGIDRVELRASSFDLRPKVEDRSSKFEPGDNHHAKSL